MAADPNLKIQITTEADLAAAKAAEQAIGDIKGAAQTAESPLENVAKASGKSADALGEIRKAGGPAAQILRGLNTAGQGGIATFFGLAQAIRGVVAAITAGLGPIGLLVAALGLAAGVILAFKDKLFGAGKSIDEFAKKSQDARKAVDDLNKGRLDAVAAQYDAAAASADRYRAAIEAVRMVESDSIAANEAIALAKLKARTDLSDVQRLEQEQRIRDDSRTARNRVADTGEDPRIVSADLAAKRAIDTITALQQNIATLETEKRKLAATPGALAFQVEQAKEAQSVASRRLLSGVDPLPGGVDAALAASRKANEDLANARAAQAASQKTFTEDIKTAEGKLLSATDALAKTITERDQAIEKLGNAAVTISAEQKARDARDRGTAGVGAIDLTVAQREQAAAEAKAARERAEAIASKRASAAADREAVERKFAEPLAEADQAIAGAPDDQVAINKLIAARLALELAKQRELDRIADDFNRAAAALQTPAATPAEGSPRPPGAGDSRNVLQRGGGPLPGDKGFEVDTKPMQDAFNEGAETLQRVTVPPIDPSPMAASVDQVNARLSQEVGGFANQVVGLIGQINVSLESQRQRIRVLEGRLNSLA